MAVRAAIATGNFLTAGTWGAIDATSYNNTETTTTVLTTSYQASTGATTGVITVDGVGLKLSVRTGTTGTMSVHLAIAGVEVPGTLVTINTADLPVAATADLNGGWIFFQFAAPVALAGATSYTVEAKTSSASQVSLFSTATTNWARYLRTTTTGAPAAGDDLIVTGIHTTTGAPAAVTVTMDALASSITDYGAASTSLVTPSLAIGNSGSLVFGTTAATNYYLRQSGNVIVYSGGTLSQGTTGTKCPRDSTMKLNFDCGANVDFGLTVRNLGTWNSQGLSRTSGKDIVACKLNTDEAIASTSLGVDTDTGWLDNDQIAVASTTRTIADCEGGTLNGNAGASTLTVDGFAGAGGGLAVAHSGTSPTQAEIILLTRNVSVFGASATLQAYIDIKATATIDCDWTEFYWLGSATALKRGIDTACTTGVQSFQYCSRHTSTVASSIGWNMSGASGTGLTISNCVSFNIDLQHINLTTANSGTWIIDSNICIRSIGVGILIFLNDIGGTCTNNTVAGSATTGISLGENNGVVGTFDGNTAHSNSGIGIDFQSAAINSTVSNLIIWRNGNSGLRFNGNAPGAITLSTVTLFGNTTTNIAFAAGQGNIKFISLVSNGDSTFATTSGIGFTATSSCAADVMFINCNFGTVSGIKTAHTQDVNITTNSYCTFVFINSILASATEVNNNAGLVPGSYIASQKHDQTAGLHKTWKKYGIITIDTGTVHTGSQSVKLTPNNASNKLESSSFFAAVASGATVTPTIYVYEDASYNGARSRLIVKRNDAIGITADTVLATATAASDAAWEGLTGATIAATDDGVMEFVIDCDGTAGNLFVDSASVA